ncbi:MAG: TonB-dependent receptor [Sphingobium sp.]
MLKSSLTVSSASLLTLAMLSLSAPAVAAPEPAGAVAGAATAELPEEGGGDIVVTALRRNSTVQDTPISIAALSGETITKSGATQLQDYFRQVPNLNLTQGQIGTNRISIRGINAAGEATVGLYYDETPVTGPSGTTQDSGAVAADLNLFDVQRVEVLRGPQGTLYGASSMAGTLRVIFNKPDLEDYDYGGEVQASSTWHGSAGYFVKGMVNAPIVSGKLAVRVAGYYEQRPGYIDNIRFNQRNINDSSNWGVRGLVRFAPDEDTDILATAIYQRSTSDDQQGYYPMLGNYKTNSAVKLPFNSKMQLYNLKVDRSLTDNLKLTGTASYYQFNILRALDFTPAVAALSFSPAGCQSYFSLGTACSSAQLGAYSAYGLSRTPAVGYQPASLKAQDYEVRLSNGDDGWLHWTVGAFFEHRRDHIDSQTVSVNPSTGEVTTPLNFISYRYVETGQHQIAGFGDISIEPVTGLTISGGARYFDYSKTTSGATLIASPLSATVLSPYSEQTAKAHGWLEKINVSYKITPDVLVYATASKGFRPGGANNVPGLPARLVSYAPDSLWNYEAGVKSSWLRNKLVVNIAAFQIDWDNMQVSGRTADGLFSFLTNAGKARIRGGEADITVRPLRGLSLTGAAGYLDAHLTADQSNSSVLVTATTGRAGDPIPNTPEWTASASAEYSWPLSDQLDGLLRADFAYTGRMQSSFRTADPYFTTSGNYSSLNLRAGIEREKWGLYLFCQNVADVVGTTAVSSGLGYSNLSFTIPPRTVGINFRFGR